MKLYDNVKPKHGLIPIHTDAPEMFKEIIPGGNVILLKDGEEFCL
jgi:mRNA degradation ribonuclease J1/J2